jgi:hypothetical protein
MSEAPPHYGSAFRYITQSDVSHAADSLLRSGMRPTIEKIRAKIGKGSPNTINPMLDAWWKTLSARLDAGPAALHRLPETVAHIAEALWMQALEEGRRRAQQELKTSERQAADHQQNLEVRSHVLTLREGELDSRLRDRDRTIEALQLQVNALTGLLRKEQATRELLSRHIAELQTAARPRPKPRQRQKSAARKNKVKSTKKARSKKIRRRAPIARGAISAYRLRGT